MLSDFTLASWKQRMKYLTVRRKCEKKRKKLKGNVGAFGGQKNKLIVTKFTVFKLDLTVFKLCLLK